MARNTSRYGKYGQTMEQRFTPSQSAEMTKRKLPPGVTIGDVNEAGGNPMQRIPRNPRIDSADVPRRKASNEGNEPKTITIQYKHGGYVCPPNQRTGNIDMRKTGMTRSVKDNRKKG